MRDDDPPKESDPVSPDEETADANAEEVIGDLGEPTREEAAPSTSGPVTLLIRRAVEGDSDARGELVAQFYDQLRQVARQLVNRGTPTLSATILVHELFVRLKQSEVFSVRDSQHFLRYAARAMRNIIKDGVRRLKAEKRPTSRVQEPLLDVIESYESRAENLLLLNEGLELLEKEDQRLAAIFELRFFLGVSTAEIADILGADQRTVQRELQFARQWLGKYYR